jgi:Protein of unknown function (DUF3617)
MHSPRSLCIAATLLALAAQAPAARAVPPMLPGLWELRVTTTLNKQAQPPETVQECLSQKDIDHETRTLPLPEGKCALSNVVTAGEHATYDMVCTRDEYTTRGRMELFIHAETYDGMSDLKIGAPGKSDTPMTVLVNARRIGNCSK